MDPGDHAGDSHVWYLSYGSNMCWQRFQCYIEGGSPPGARVVQPGCRCPDHPLQNEWLRVPGWRLSFPKPSSWWGGSVASVHKAEDGFFFGRIYLITREQFVDIVCQENSLASGTLSTDVIDQVCRLGHKEVLTGAYGTCVYLGDHKGRPVLNFTTSVEYMPRLHTLTAVREESRKPSHAYLSVIIKGLSEDSPCTKLSKLLEYLLLVPEVRHHWPSTELAAIAIEQGWRVTAAESATHPLTADELDKMPLRELFLIAEQLAVPWDHVFHRRELLEFLLASPEMHSKVEEATPDSPCETRGIPFCLRGQGI